MFISVERVEATGTAEAIAAAESGRAALHMSGTTMCGPCHQEMTDAYADYYHGAAYQRGASDAPACWDCHGAHEMLPASDRRSPVNKANLVETCGKCHDDVNEEYIQYADLVHRRAEVEAEVPIFAFFDSTRSVLRGAFQTVSSWFQR
jgi:nitrate/TMAO reductase-like tetraheme cytochrome c subunit